VKTDQSYWRVYATHADGREVTERCNTHGQAMLAWSRFLAAGLDAEIMRIDADGTQALLIERLQCSR
jgi:hypothetical protein